MGPHSATMLDGILVLAGWLIALPLSIVLSYLSLELAFGLKRQRADRVMPSDSIPRTCVLIPAHDEEAGIAATVRSVRETAPWADILVVADNCSDATAAIARDAGAQVSERHDPQDRGKGFALAHGRSMLAGSADTLSDAVPEAIIVLDADCRIDPGSIEKLARRAVVQNQPVQASNLLISDPDQPPLVAISNFAMLIKNRVRARGLMRLGGGALLFGTGMAFPWELFSRLQLATSNAVEDLDLGVTLARQGTAVALDDTARVTSPPAAMADSHGQRSRWEHGFLSTALTSALPMIGSGIARGSRNLATIGAHLLVPPLALLMIASILGLIVVGGLAVFHESWAAFAVIATVFTFTALLLLAAWWREGRTVLSLGALMRIPLYVAWKIPIYLAFLVKRQTGWNRTPRSDDRD